MKASDVVNKLTLEVHKYTDLFSDSVDITSISRTGGEATITTSSPHGLYPGYGFYITGVAVPLSISTLTRAGTVGTLVTAEDHDLTMPIADEITITSAADSNFNGTFDVLSIPNRKTITFTMIDSSATSTTGGKLMSAVRYDQQFNGFHDVVSVPTDSSLTFADASALDASATGGKVKKNLRVSSAATMERVLDAFTKQATDKFYLFVVLGDVAATNSASTKQDVTALINRNENYRQVLKETVGLFVLGSTKDEIGGRIARDLMSDLLPALTKSIAFYQFPSSFYVGSSHPLVFVSHANRVYDGVIYVHEFIFEASTEMVINDTVGYSPDVAFRNIDLTQYPNLDGTGEILSAINLDEVPL